MDSIILFYLKLILLHFSFITFFLYAAFMCFRNRFAAPSKNGQFPPPPFPVLKGLATCQKLALLPSISPEPVSFFLTLTNQFPVTYAQRAETSRSVHHINAEV